MTKHRNLQEALREVTEELEIGVARARDGSTSAYQTIATYLRKLVGAHRGNDLLCRVIPEATLHKLVAQPPPLSVEELEKLTPGGRWLEEQDRGPQFAGIYSINRVTFSYPLQVEIQFDLSSESLPVQEWREQILVNTSPPILVGKFIQTLGNQEGAHTDDEIHRAIRKVDDLADQRPAARAVIVGLGEYVAGRVRELIAERE
jgi:hypothetical protein